VPAIAYPAVPDVQAHPSQHHLKNIEVHGSVSLEIQKNICKKKT
jgi:hypothetical protein